MKWTLPVALLIGLIFSTELSQALARAARTQEVPLPATVVSFGESISAGALATYERRDWYNPLLMFKLLAQAAAMKVAGTFAPLESKSYRWATGMSKNKKFLSHFGRLRALSRGTAKLAAIEAGISGGTMDDFSKEWEKYLKKHPAVDRENYYLFMIGVNDACGWLDRPPTPPREYEARVRKAISQIRERDERGKILVVGLPDLERLRVVGQSAKAGPWGSCVNVWKFHGFCRNFLLEPDEDKRSETLARVASYNEILRDIVAEQDQGQDRLRYSGRVADVQFSADDLSLDCFHPNRAGQAKISEETWRDSWWSSGAK